MKIKEQAELKKIASLMEVIRDIRQVMRNHFSQKVKEHDMDVTIEMLETLYVLWKKDGINQQEIVEKTNKSKASVTSLLDNLASRNLIQRNPDPNDRRSNLVALTNEGKSYQKKLIPLLEEVYDSFLQDITPEELENTTKVLDRIYQKMTE